MDDDQERAAAEEALPSRDIISTLARWGREKGDVQVCNRSTGEVVTISWGDLTDVWKEDLRRQKAARAR
jgi:hypothetical protein